MTILLKRAHVIDPSQNIDMFGDIFVKDGKIAEIGEDLFPLAANTDKIIDCDGLVAMPGLVDMHVHLRDPGQTHKEDVFSACRAAAAGGVTSLLAMPNTTPSMDSPKLVKELLKKSEKADAAVYVAACITKGLEGNTLTDLMALKKSGAVAFSDDGQPVKDTSCLLEALRFCNSEGVALTAHCEDKYLANGGIINEGEISRKLGVKGIPNAAEDCGTAREIAAAASIGARIHICHVSTKGSVELIRDAKRRGIKVTAETCPHYLMFTEDVLVTRDADYRMNPPLRTEEDRLALIEGLKDGTIDAISTDHAPHTPEEKSDFLTAPNGSIGMETSLAATLTALDGIMSLSDIIEKMSTKPAGILGIPAGTLKIGANADIAVFSPECNWTVEPNALHGKSKNTPFKGMTLKGRVVTTIYHGKKVFDIR